MDAGLVVPMPRASAGGVRGWRACPARSWRACPAHSWRACPARSRRTCSAPCPPGASRGHTLIELLAALGIVAILATLAVPSFLDFGANLRRDARVRELRNTLVLARTEALARGVPVVVCAGSTTCRAGGTWRTGWFAFADARAPRGQRTADEPVLVRIGSAPEVDVRANRTSLAFQPSAVAATTATFAICDRRGAAAARTLVVSRTGRVRGAERDPSGGAPDCG